MITLFDPRVWLVLLLSHGLMFWGGNHHGKTVIKNEVAAEALKVKAKQDAVVDIEATKEVKGQEKVRTIFKDRIIIQEKKVPYEVIVHQDAKCDVPERFVRLWNSANRAELPDDASLIAEGPSGVKLSEVGTQHEREAEACLANLVQLKSIIAAVKKVEAIK